MSRAVLKVFTIAAIVVAEYAVAAKLLLMATTGTKYLSDFEALFVGFGLTTFAMASVPVTVAAAKAVWDWKR